jgi:predicted DNA repair protein MutK
MDDAGYKLQKNLKEGGFLFSIGQLLINMLPWVIKILGVVGTIALILVAGGIFLHNIEYIHHLAEKLPTPAVANEFAAELLVVCWLWL